MAALFSSAWFVAVGEMLEAAVNKGVLGGEPDLRVAVGFEVLGATSELTGVELAALDGEGGATVAYTIVADRARAEVLVGSLEQAEVVITEDYETAALLATGALTASEAIATGRVRCRGSIDRLVAAAPLLAVLADVFSASAAIVDP